MFGKMPGLIRAAVACACVLVCLERTNGQIVLVPEVATEEGIVRGNTEFSRTSKEFYSFLTIPYAERPERFKPAVKKGRWNGILDTQKKGSMCPQLMPGELGAFTGVMGAEDCLHLNVYTPFSNGEQLLPVMVFIHGGAFIFLSGDDFRGDYFMEEEVVVVTINYRLGALGFLYFEDDTVPGNLGMKDQVLGLEWVKRNIHHFGGDPEKVTIFGESAGAASVVYHMLSPLSKGLFRGVIAESGSALAPWALSEHPRENGLRFSKAVGCPSDDTKKALACLKEVDLESLLEEQVAEENWGPSILYKWAPVVEVGDGANLTDAFITKSPKQIFDEGSVPNQVPLIIGVNKNEGVLIFSGVILKEEAYTQNMNNKWSAIAPKLFYYSHPNDNSLEKEREVASMKIRDFYFEGLAVGHETEQRLTDLFSDAYFVHPVVQTVKAYSHIAPTYNYLFTFYGGFSLGHMANIEHYDPPTHGDELHLLLRFTLRFEVGNEELHFSKNFVKLWSSFAKYGAPNETWGPATEWKPAGKKAENLKWYVLDNKTAVIDDIFKRRTSFWEHLKSNELTQMY